MNNGPLFTAGLKKYHVRSLTMADAATLQRLFEACSDFIRTVEGDSVSAGEAVETLLMVPPEHSFENKFVFGLLDEDEHIVGVLEGLRHYPHQNCWWIGLLMLTPEVRGLGLARRWVNHFVESAQLGRAEAVMLGVVEDNQPALIFWDKMGFEWMRKTPPREFRKKRQAVIVLRRCL
jgi:GNAT superfamily N-acetyltransferase